MEEKLFQQMYITEMMPGMWFGSYDAGIMTRIGWYMYGYVDASSSDSPQTKADFWKRFTFLVMDYLHSSDLSDYAQGWERIIQKYITDPKSQIKTFYSILHEYDHLYLQQRK